MGGGYSESRITLLFKNRYFLRGKNPGTSTPKNIDGYFQTSTTDSRPRIPSPSVYQSTGHIDCMKTCGVALSQVETCFILRSARETHRIHTNTPPLCLLKKPSCENCNTTQHRVLVLVPAYQRHFCTQL